LILLTEFTAFLLDGVDSGEATQVPVMIMLLIPVDSNG
jgi:hypothetical protein